MQKKVLLPLIIAGPFSLPALADIDYKFPNVQDWNAPNSVYPDGFKVGDSTTDVDAAVGTGTIISQVIEGYPAGDYQLVFSSVSNIRVSINGKELTPETSGTNTVYAFSLEKGESFQIEVSPEIASEPFSFSGLNLVLIFDVTKAQGDVSKILNELRAYCPTIEEVDDEDTGEYFKQGDALREERQALADIYYPGASSANMMVKYEDGTEVSADQLYKWLNQYKNDPTKLAEIYSQYGYDQTPTYPVAYFTEILERAKELNDEIIEENRLFGNYETNLGNYNNFSEQYENLNSKIAAQQTQLDASKGISEELLDQYRQKLADIQGDVTNWWNSVEGAYPHPILENENTWRDDIIDMDSIEANLSDINKDLQELSENIGNADADWKIYYQVNFVNLPNLKKAYEDLIGYLDSVKGVTGYEDNFTDYVKEVAENALGEYNDAKDKIIPEIEGAVEYNDTNECQKTILAAIEWLEKQLETSTDLVNGQNQNMTDALDTLDGENGFNTQLSEIVDGVVVPDKYKEEWDGLVKAAEDAIAEFKEYIEGEYADLKLDTEAPEYTAAAKKAQDAIDTLKDYADTHDFAALKGIQDKLDEAWEEIEEKYPSFTDQLEKERDAIQDEINKLDPTSSTLQDSIKDIEGQIDDMLADAKTLQDLQDKLDDTWADIEENYNEWVQGKVGGDKGNLQDAIDALDPTSDSFDDSVKAIDDQIDQMAQAAKDLNQAYNDIKNEIDKVQSAFTNFDNLIKNKEIQSHEGFEDSTFDALNSYLTNYKESKDTELSKAQARLSDYNEQFTAYQQLDGQDCLDKLNELLKAIQDDQAFGADLTNAEIAFEKGGTEINSTTVQGVIDGIDLSEYSEYAGFDGLETELADIKKDLTDIQSKIGTASTVEDYTGIDSELDGLLDDVITLQENIKKVVDNKTAYDEQTAQLGILNNWLEALRKYNEDFSMEPAQSFFTGKIGELQTEFNTLQEDINEYYDNVESATKAETINGKISAFDQKVLETYRWCRDNNNAFNAQLDKATEVNSYIKGLISTIDNMLADMEEGTVTELLNNWRSDLQDLLTESTDPLNWNAVNILASGYYGEGDSANNNEEIIEDYDALMTAAKDIDDQLNGDTYHNAVVGANTATTSEWGGIYDQLNNDYLDGIRDFNYYFLTPGLENEGWKAYVEEKGIEQSHKVLFDFYDQFNSLNTEVLEFIAEQNANNHVITSAEWQEYLDRAQKIEDDIEGQVTELVSDMNSAAVEYYAILHGKVEKAFTEAEGILGAQGIPTSPYMDTIKATDKKAEGMYDTSTSKPESIDPTEVPYQVGGMMDGIANLLDTCLPPYDYQAWAQAQWDTEYKDAQSAINGFREDINKAVFADSDYRQQQMEQFEDIVDQINDLNEEVKGVTEGLIDDFGGYSDKLDGLLSQLEQIKDNIQKNSDNNVAEQDAYNQFQKDLAETLIPGLDDLDAYAKSLAGAANKTIGEEINGPIDPEPGLYGGIKGNIEALTQCVEENKGNLLNLVPSVEDRVDAIEAAIVAEYEKVAKAESTYLMSTLYGKMVKEAFNNAYEFIKSAEEEPAVPSGYDTWDDYFNSMNEAINEYEPLLGEAGTWYGEYSYEPEEARIAWRDKSVEMEKALCEIYASLQSVWTSYPVEGVVSNLDSQKDEIQNQLDAAMAALAGYEYLSAEQKEELSNRYAKIQIALDSEAEEWTNEGDWVIAREAFHEVALMFLGLDIEDIAGDAQEAETIAKDAADKKAASDARFGELEAEYSDLLSQYEELQSQIGGYSENIQDAYESSLENIKDMLDDAYENLQEGYEAGTLTPDSQLQNASEIQKAIDQTKNGAALMNANEQLAKAKASRDNANQALRKHIVPAIYDELFKEYTDLNNELNQMLDDVMLPDADLAQISERAKELAELFDRIEEQAQENTYYLGDVNDDPDGEVNVLDVQILINWVGEGMTYEELYELNPRQALAADVTGDHEIDIADVTTLIQWIINGQVEEINGLRVKSRTAVEDSNNAIEIQLVEEVNGFRTYAINLNNSTVFRAGQLDIVATGNSRINIVTGADRTFNHDVLTFNNDDNTTRVVIVSMNNYDIMNDNGSIIYVTVEGDGDIIVDNAIFSDSDNRAHKLGKNVSTGVNGIIDTLKDYGEKIYDAAGRMYNKVQRGINIIRHKDGSVTKEIRK